MKQSWQNANDWIIHLTMLELKTTGKSLTYINMQKYNVATQYWTVVLQIGAGNIVIKNGAQKNYWICLANIVIIVFNSGWLRLSFDVKVAGMIVMFRDLQKAQMLCHYWKVKLN